MYIAKIFLIFLLFLLNFFFPAWKLNHILQLLFWGPGKSESKQGESLPAANVLFWGDEASHYWQVSLEMSGSLAQIKNVIWVKIPKKDLSVAKKTLHFISCLVDHEPSKWGVDNDKITICGPMHHRRYEKEAKRSEWRKKFVCKVMVGKKANQMKIYFEKHEKHKTL